MRIEAAFEKAGDDEIAEIRCLASQEEATIITANRRTRELPARARRQKKLGRQGDSVAHPEIADEVVELSTERRGRHPAARTEGTNLPSPRSETCALFLFDCADFGLFDIQRSSEFIVNHPNTGRRTMG